MPAELCALNEAWEFGPQRVRLWTSYRDLGADDNSGVDLERFERVDPLRDGSGEALVGQRRLVLATHLKTTFAQASFERLSKMRVLKTIRGKNSRANAAQAKVFIQAPSAIIYMQLPLSRPVFIAKDFLEF